MRFWGHLINTDLSDVFNISGSNGIMPGKITYNHKFDWEKFKRVDIATKGGKHIIEAAMS